MSHLLNLLIQLATFLIVPLEQGGIGLVQGFQKPLNLLVLAPGARDVPFKYVGKLRYSVVFGC